MKTHTSQFKSAIKNMGRQIDSIITYDNTTLHDELYAVTPHFEANILKSVMKQLDIESSVSIPIGTLVNYQLGVMVGGAYEYLNYGNYIVYNVEKVEDEDKYTITCYDKMLNAMKPYENLNISYPITLKNFLSAIATKIGLTVNATTFYNQSNTISSELYLGLDYTFRDVLDEIAQATGSIICINNNDELEVKYTNVTNDTIDEEFLKDVNVKFGQKYGPINSIVLSRSAESDNVYLNDDESIQENGLCEIKIVDNQIMNGNDRSNYLQGIFNALDGFYYYINDFSSTGILYYDLGDVYNVEVGSNTYQCVMLNDEINVTQGIEELIHTEMLEQSETDYTKADKTDMRINKTYLIVDKQNQEIQAVIDNVSEQDSKIASITLTVNELNSKISDISDVTISKESTDGILEFEDINMSQPVSINIHPTGVNISYLYPRDNLYPSDILYMPVRTLKFENTETEDVFTYELPTDLLYYDSETYDEFIMEYGDNQSQNVCQVIKKVGYNADGTTYALQTPETITYSYPTIALTAGDYEITMPGYSSVYMFVRLMSKNIYTSQFVTRVEQSSAISQMASQILSTVSATYATLDTTETLSTRISQTATTIELTATDNNTSAGISIKLKNEDGEQIDSATANITLSGLVKFTDLSGANNYTTINGSNIKTGTIDASQVTVTNLNASNITSGTISADKINGGTFTGSSINLGNGKFTVTSGGKLTATDATISGTITATSGTFQNCTITNSCTVPASTVNGTLATSNIPNLNANKITSGKISASLLEGVNASFGSLGASSISSQTIKGDYVSVNTTSGHFEIGGYSGQNFSLIVQHEGQYWRRLVFRGGILTAVQSSW